MNKPCIVKVEDGSTLIEFIDKNWRFGIVIDKNLKDSSWHLVFKKEKLKEEGYCGELSEEMYTLLNK